MPNSRRSISLQVNLGWTLAGNILLSACQWGMLVALAKLSRPAALGQFSLGLAIATPAVTFMQLHLRSVQATDAKGRFQFSDYLGLRFTMMLIAALVVAGIIAIGHYDKTTSLIIALVTATKIVESFSDIYYGLLQQHDLMSQIAKSMCVRGVLGLVSLSVTMWVTHSIVFAALALALSSALVFVMRDLNAVAYTRRHSVFQSASAVSNRVEFCGRTQARLARLAFPLGLVMMLIALNTSIPRFYIERYRGASDLGIFTAISYLVVAVSTIIVALGQAATPTLSRYIAADNTSAFLMLLGKILGATGAISVLALITSFLFGAPLLRLLYRPEYALHLATFHVVMASACVSCVGSVLGFGLTAARLFTPQLPVFGAAAGSCALASYLLIPPYGILGAAYALLIACMVQAAVSAFILYQQIFRVRLINEVVAA